MAAVGLQIAQVGQRQQVATRGGAGQAGTLGGQRGVEALALGIEALQHRQPLGQAGDVVRSGNVHGATIPDSPAGCGILRGDRTTRTITAQSM